MFPILIVLNLTLRIILKSKKIKTLGWLCDENLVFVQNKLTHGLVWELLNLRLVPHCALKPCLNISIYLFQFKKDILLIFLRLFFVLNWYGQTLALSEETVYQLAFLFIKAVQRKIQFREVSLQSDRLSWYSSGFAAIYEVKVDNLWSMEHIYKHLVISQETCVNQWIVESSNSLWTRINIEKLIHADLMLYRAQVKNNKVEDSSIKIGNTE